MSTDDEKAAAFEQFKKLQEVLTEVVYKVLCICESEKDVRKFFEISLKKAQTRWADENSDRIMSALVDGLEKMGEAQNKELAKKRRILEALRKAAAEE